MQQPQPLFKALKGKNHPVDAVSTSPQIQSVVDTINLTLLQSSADQIPVNTALQLTGLPTPINTTGILLIQAFGNTF